MTWGPVVRSIERDCVCLALFYDSHFVTIHALNSIWWRLSNERSSFHRQSLWFNIWASIRTDGRTVDLTFARWTPVILRLWPRVYGSSWLIIKRIEFFASYDSFVCEFMIDDVTSLSPWQPGHWLCFAGWICTAWGRFRGGLSRGERRRWPRRSNLLIRVIKLGYLWTLVSYILPVYDRWSALSSLAE